VSLLDVQAVSKAFPGVRALDAVDFDVRRGEIHALVGENGAGKSTLIKVLAGAVAPDRGELRFDGGPLPSGDPRAVQRRGLSIVHQETTLVPELSAAENMFLGREQGRWLLRRRAMREAAQRVLDGLGARLEASAPVRAASVAQRQLVEIARALAGESKLLLLDEPTAALAPPEVERLFAALRRQRERGLGLVYVSHRLDEVFALADRVTVLRDGRRVASARVADVDRAGLIRSMVGRDVAEEFPARTPRPGPVLLELSHLACPPYFTDVSLTVREGEVVGLAGLVGAGRTSVALSVFGVLPAGGGLLLGGQPARFRSPAEALAGGVGYVTEDRKQRGVFPLLDVADNLTLTQLRAGWLAPGRQRAMAAAAVRDFGVRTSSLAQAAGTLSGGNQQKLLIARCLLGPRRLLLLDEPTRGIDVGARAEIYALINRLSAQGLGILLISSDLPELLGMSDRVVVVHAGRTAGELPRGQATPERVMALATGGA
jgi:ABC-type sugar transport system ATPase subunit